MMIVDIPDNRMPINSQRGFDQRFLRNRNKMSDWDRELEEDNEYDGEGPYTSMFSRAEPRRHHHRHHSFNPFGDIGREMRQMERRMAHDFDSFGSGFGNDFGHGFHSVDN
jgi:hypothetical protein